MLQGFIVTAHYDPIAIFKTCVSDKTPFTCNYDVTAFYGKWQKLIITKT